MVLSFSKKCSGFYIIIDDLSVSYLYSSNLYYKPKQCKKYNYFYISSKIATDLVKISCTCISLVGMYSSLNALPWNLPSNVLFPVFLSPLITIFTTKTKYYTLTWSIRMFILFQHVMFAFPYTNYDLMFLEKQQYK